MDINKIFEDEWVYRVAWDTDDGPDNSYSCNFRATAEEEAARMLEANKKLTMPDRNIRIQRARRQSWFDCSLKLN